MSGILVEQVLRFKVAATGQVVHVASDKAGMAAVIEILTALSKTGKGLPSGTVVEGTVADMNYDPRYLVDSDENPLLECPLPPEWIYFPEVPGATGLCPTCDMFGPQHCNTPGHREKA